MSDVLKGKCEEYNKTISVQFRDTFEFRMSARYHLCPTSDEIAYICLYKILNKLDEVKAIEYVFKDLEFRDILYFRLIFHLYRIEKFNG